MTQDAENGRMTKLRRFLRWLARELEKGNPDRWDTPAEAKWRALSPDERRRRAQRHIDGTDG